MSFTGSQQEKSGATIDRHGDLSIRDGLARASAIFDVFVLPFRRYPWLIFGVAGLTAAISFLGTLLMRTEFRSTATFFVDRTKPAASLPAGLASLGRSLGLGDGDDAQPLEFYAWLARSDDVLKAVLNDTVPRALRIPRGDSLDGTVWYQLLRKPHPVDSVKLAEGLAMVRQRLRTGVDLSTSTITVTAPGPTRELAMWNAQRVFSAVNEASTTRRTTRARNELDFLRERTREAESTLRASEAALAAFYETNRQSVLPPFLRFEEERRRRKVDISRDAYLGLTKSVQEVELRAVRNIPALSLIDGPTVPIRQSKPRRLLLTILGGLFGLAIAYTIAWWRVEGQQSKAYDERRGGFLP